MMTAKYIIPASIEPLPPDRVVEMLDEEIRAWRAKRATAVDGTPDHVAATAAVTAYQRARLWLAGSVLQP